mmetsp:Transcript_24746/g.33997  ORF Transcript_24746/g.33997 Transcript_24746/m.33997 type:complete len:1591 (-) Transcript_24746:85-4857(-)
MGAESSTLQGIESLNSSLLEMKQKLDAVENAHVHLGNSLNNDMSDILHMDTKVIAHGQSIWCRESINLVVGPVIGLVLCNSVRILVEVNLDAKICCYVYKRETITVHTDAPKGVESSSRYQYVKKSSMLLTSYVPMAISIEDLIPNSFYLIYIGGIRSSDTVEKYASFRTPPAAVAAKLADRTKSTRLFISQSGRIDKMVPNESNMFKSMQQRVNCENAMENNNPVQIFVHCGSLLNVDEIIKSKAINMLNGILRDDSPSQSWLQDVSELENEVRELYRKALNEDHLSSIIRQCSSFFLCDNGEDASETTALFLAQSQTKVTEDKQGGSEIKSVKSAPTRSKAKTGEDSTLAGGSSISSQLLLGESVRRSRQEAKQRSQERTEAQEELRLLLLGIILRAVRRISWSYFRQLWDSDYEYLMQEDLTRDTHYREILKLRKTTYVSRSLYLNVESSIAKVLQNFGEDSKAAESLISHGESIAKEIKQLEEKLRVVAVESSNFNTSMSTRPNGTCCCIGDFCLVLIETAWGHVGADGQIQHHQKVDTEGLSPLEVDIHEQIFDDLEAFIYPEIDENNNKSHTRRSTTVVNSIMVISTSPLMTFNSPNHDGDEPSSDGFVNWSYKVAKDGSNSSLNSRVALSDIDKKRLLKTVAKWQQESEDRAVLLVGNSDTSFAVKGVAYPLTVTDEGVELITEEQLESAENIAFNIWNKERSKLQQILIGKLSQSSRTILPDVLSAGENLHLTKHANMQFKSQFDLETVCSRRSYWDVRFCPIIYPERLPNGSFLAERPATFQVDLITDVARPDFNNASNARRVILGPIVLSVTSNSALLMVELAYSGHVELLCVDQVTGAEFICTQLSTALRPSFFFFEKLHPNRPYDVIIAEPFEFDHHNNFIACEIASFTTHRRLFMTADDIIEIDDAKAAEELRRISNREIPNTGDNTSLASVNKSGSVSVVNEGKSSLKSNQSSSFSILAVGSNKPSDISIEFLGQQEQLLTGIEMCRHVGNSTSQAWTEVDIVLHCGEVVDFGPVLSHAVSLLTKAEVAENNRANREVVDKYLLAAEEKLRDAYRFHWCSAATHDMLSHGSHYMMTSPLLALLSAFHVNSIRQLERELSPFCCSHLVQLFSSIDASYRGSSLNSKFHSTTSYYADGSVVFFQLQPNIARQMHMGPDFVMDEGLIDEAQFVALKKLLMHPFSHWNDTTRKEGPLKYTFVLLSPIPVVLDDEFFDDYSSIPKESKSVRYGHRELAVLMDLLATWLEVNPKTREVIILTGGASASFSTTIQICGISDAQTNIKDNISLESSLLTSKVDPSAQHRITQICCGPLLGIPQSGQLSLIDSSLHSPTREFKFRHQPMYDNSSSSSYQSLCALIEIPLDRKVKQKGSFKKSSFEFLDSSSLAIINEKYLACEKYPTVLRPRLNESREALALIRRVQTVLEMKEETNDAEAVSNIEKAIDYVLNKADSVVRRCHLLFIRHEIFPLPIRGDLCVVKSLHSICQWILSQLHEPQRQICKFPSSLSIWLVWESRKTKVAAQKLSSLAVETGEEGSQFSAEITAQLQADFDMFRGFLKDCFLVQLLLEYFAFTSGLNDV